jgi:hypothetical protein
MKRLTLELPPEFVALCASDGVKPELVLRGFVADLCQLYTKDYNSNGSDECDCARNYYERVGYPY